MTADFRRLWARHGLLIGATGRRAQEESSRPSVVWRAVHLHSLQHSKFSHIHMCCKKKVKENETAVTLLTANRTHPPLVVINLFFHHVSVQTACFGNPRSVHRPASSLGLLQITMYTGGGGGPPYMYS